MDASVFQILSKLHKILSEKVSASDISDNELVYVTAKLESILEMYGESMPSNGVDGVVSRKSWWQRFTDGE